MQTFQSNPAKVGVSLPYREEIKKMAKCPYCKIDVNFENIETEKKGLGFFKQEIMYLCPGCKSVLGISRGKWSG